MNHYPRCERCGKETQVSTCSRFNTQQICMECAKVEREHPLYGLARDIEYEHIKQGDYNYEGIGLPQDITPVKRDS